MMVYDLKHWDNPRLTIATKFKDNDFAYSTDGALGAAQIYAMFDLKPSDAAKLTILDYGCGTGRIARMMTRLFKNVIAYDPVPACIEEFKKENELTCKDYLNLFMTSDINDVALCDLAYSINVIEHLDENGQKYMIEQLINKVSGEIVINYCAKRNKNIMKPFLSDKEKKSDDGCRIVLRKLKFTT